jgi:hypothetical protein
MEAAWQALAVEHGWLNGEIVKNARASYNERVYLLIAAATIVCGIGLWLLFLDYVMWSYRRNWLARRKSLLLIKGSASFARSRRTRALFL